MAKFACREVWNLYHEVIPLTHSGQYNVLIVNWPAIKKRLIKEVQYIIKYHRLSMQNLNAGTINFQRRGGPKHSDSALKVYDI